MKTEDIKKAERLAKSINDMKYFINTFNEEANIVRGSGSRDINGVVKIQTDKNISIFGSRWFGCGTHKVELELPVGMISVIEKCYKEKLKELENELEQL